MEDKFKSMRDYYEVEKNFEWNKWITLIPFISFPKEWRIQPIPPFGGTIVRFRVKKENSNNFVSIYLDCYDILGIFGEPYWEVYPYNDDVGRCPMNDIKQLLEMIECGLEPNKEVFKKELNTLNDMDFEFNFSNKDTRESLRKEAIKWIKELKGYGDTICGEGCCFKGEGSPYVPKITGHLFDTEPVINWIVDFFNISEKDLEEIDKE